MAGRQSPSKDLSSDDDDDSDEDKLEISKVKAKLGAKVEMKEGRLLAVKWRKRDQFGRLIIQSPSSSKTYSKRQKKACQTQQPNTSAEHVADSTEGTFTSDVQETHNMIDLHIKELQKLLEAVEEDDGGTSSASYGRTWTVRQALCLERWQKARPQLLEAMLEAGKIPKGLCQVCKVKDAVICCTDCRPKQMLCSKCDCTVHRQYSLHNRCLVVGGSYKALPPTTIIAEEASCEPSLCEEVRLLPFALPKNICSCDAENVSVSGGQKVIFININGRYDLHVPLLTCENCHCQWTPQLKDLVSNGYWPGTIDFHTVFAIDVFLTFEDLKISAPGLSRHAFIRMLESRSLRAGRVMHILDKL